MKIRDYRKKIPFTNYSKGRGNWTPGLITLHTTEGSYEGACSWFCNSASGVSAHFVVGLSGEITQCVDLADTAYVNGTSFNSDDKRYYGKATNPIVKQRNANANSYTVGIEITGFYNEKAKQCTMTDDQKNAVIELIDYIITEVKKKYGNSIPVDRTRICGHYEVNPITKPNCGRGFPYEEIIKGVLNLRKDNAV